MRRPHYSLLFYYPKKPIWIGPNGNDLRNKFTGVRIPQKELGAPGGWLLIKACTASVRQDGGRERTHAARAVSIGMRVDRELSDAEDLQAAINVAWVLLCTALVFWEQAWVDYDHLHANPITTTTPPPPPPPQTSTAAASSFHTTTDAHRPAT